MNIKKAIIKCPYCKAEVLHEGEYKKFYPMEGWYACHVCKGRGFVINKKKIQKIRKTLGLGY